MWTGSYAPRIIKDQAAEGHTEEGENRNRKWSELSRKEGILRRIGLCIGGFKAREKLGYLSGVYFIPGEHAMREFTIVKALTPSKS